MDRDAVVPTFRISVQAYTGRLAMVGPSATRRDTSSTREVGAYSIRVSDEPDDPTWDDFLEKAPCGAHTQASCWGRARESIGWRQIRVIVSEDDRIVAGAQMETRSLPLGGKAGFVFGGPVVRDSRPDLVELVLDEMMVMGKSGNVQYLAVQPPRGSDWMCRDLARLGFRGGVLDLLYIYNPAVLSLDVRPELDELLAKCSASRRRNIRSAEQLGVSVRRGSEADLEIWNRLEHAHSARLGYVRRAESYYRDLWRALAPRGHVQLFIAEHEGEPVSAQIAIPFGDTSHHVERAWSGRHGKIGSSELLEWEAIRWAKSAGYHFVDLGGIEKSVTEAVLSGEQDSIDPTYGASLFKLRWGGQVVVEPPFLDYVYNPVLRLGYRCVPRSLMKSGWSERLAKGLKDAAPS